jgi:[ribosomal protein S18]-alanine N-acetyltransferase
MTSASHTPLRIRRLSTKEDAEHCARMISSSQPWITLQRDYARSLEILQKPDREVYLAFRRDELLGFLILNMNGPFRGYIQSICVEPAKRSTRIGPELMRFAEDRIFSESPNVFLCCSSFNPRSQRFYERLGYEVIGELRDFILAGASEIPMRKTAGPWNDFHKP